MILQPIIENAVKYGVAGAPPPSRIAISAFREGERLVLQVVDGGGGAGNGSTGAGIGLSNTEQRLRLIYGDSNAHLSAGRLADGSFRVRLAFPLEFE
jgi:two-component system, LytTR family, sensor kinase